MRSGGRLALDGVRARGAREQAEVQRQRGQARSARTSSLAWARLTPERWLVPTAAPRTLGPFRSMRRK